MRLFAVFFVLFVSLHAVRAQGLASCAATTCTNSSSCPKFSDYGNPVCSSGRCTYSPLKKLSIGEACDIYSVTSECSEGLLCSSVGMEAGTSVCQVLIPYGCSCQFDDQCDGGLCLSGRCDAIRSIGDPCSSNEQCGSVCSNSVCIAGPLNAKCNRHESCASGFCGDDFTCQQDTREACGPAHLYDGKCQEIGAVCYEGNCYSTRGDVGAVCNTSVPFPICKPSLACNGRTCQTVPEGTSCTSRTTCSALQDCVCSSASGDYGCYTTSGSGCTSSYKTYSDCLSTCSEQQSESVPDSCAHSCASFKNQYSCCLGCASNSTLYNVQGTCPDITSQPCCSTTKACSTLSRDAVCGGKTTNAPTSPPAVVPTPVPSISPATTSYIEDPRIGGSSASSLAPLFSFLFAGLLVVCGWIC